MNILKSIEWYLEHCKTDRNLSLKTIEAYRIDLLQLNDFMKSQRVTRLKKIDRTLIKSYYRSLESYSTRSIKRKLGVAKGYLNLIG